MRIWLVMVATFDGAFQAVRVYFCFIPITINLTTRLTTWLTTIFGPGLWNQTAWQAAWIHFNNWDQPISETDTISNTGTTSLNECSLHCWIYNQVKPEHRNSVRDKKISLRVLLDFATWVRTLYQWVDLCIHKYRKTEMSQKQMKLIS